ncbi:hypothetical protein [Pseudoclavibacter helvolus]|uniref:SRNA-binding protein n=1 Tax=Pseudoclavibacter helvolus TaxID=255205 RepID=A0A7W4YGT9_9MICO|nr:hypothetical protein [Pseudoclavibacter helvolus]MBB2958235.1 sRNA-binding protein [Pseudoclavibacter helvolus]
MNSTRVNEALRELAHADAQLARAQRRLEEEQRRAQAEAARELATARAEHDAEASSVANMRDSVGSLGATLGVESWDAPGRVRAAQDIHAQEQAIRQRWGHASLLEAGERAEAEERRLAAPRKVLTWTWLGLAVVGMITLHVLPSLVLA